VQILGVKYLEKSESSMQLSLFCYLFYQKSCFNNFRMLIRL